MSDHDAMLQEAIQAIDRGETTQAREILTRLLRIAPNNPEYWVWMSAAVDSPKERRYCLQKALAANPDYEPARRGLILMGDISPDDVTPVRYPAPYAWEARFKPATPEPERKNPLPRSVVIGVVALFFLMALSWGGWQVWQQVRPVHVPTPQLLINTTRTPTAMPTATPTPIDPLTLGQPTPLVMLLPATYTPTPLAVGTPHLVEAYRLGMRAMDEGRWEDALRYFQQTAQAENNQAPDLFFFIGEVYRHMQQWNDAAEAYQQALQVQPAFAPAEVGLAQTLLAQGEAQEALKLLQQATQDDPTYGMAYIVLAREHLAQGEAETALADLQNAEQYLPDSPFIPLYRAEAYLQLGDPEAAYQQAKQANDMDITLLPAYKLLGQASFALGNLKDAALYFRTYLTYAPDDPEVYRVLAETYLQMEDYAGALAAAKKVVEASPHDTEALRLLATVYLAAGQPDQAVTTLETAVRIAPRDFDMHIALVEALLSANRAGDAFHELHTIEPLLRKQEQQYTFYYWRAKVLAALDVLDAAIDDWHRVLNAPEGMVPDAWREEAQQALNELLPTDTPTATPTPTPSP